MRSAANRPGQRPGIRLALTLLCYINIDRIRRFPYKVYVCWFGKKWHLMKGWIKALVLLNMLLLLLSLLLLLLLLQFLLLFLFLLVLLLLLSLLWVMCFFLLPRHHFHCRGWPPRSATGTNWTQSNGPAQCPGYIPFLWVNHYKSTGFSLNICIEDGEQATNCRRLFRKNEGLLASPTLGIPLWDTKRNICPFHSPELFFVTSEKAFFWPALDPRPVPL